MLVGGRRKWVHYEDVRGDDSDFEQIRLGFIASCHTGPETWQWGRVAYGKARLMRIRPLIDFAVDWMARNRRS